MLDNWNVFSHFDYVGVLTYNTETTMFSFEYKGNTQNAYDTRLFLCWDKDPKWFKSALFDRVCPPNRVDIRDILRQLGMKRYDAWELIKYCHLSSCNDLVWMQKGMDPKKFYTCCMYGALLAEQDGVYNQYFDETGRRRNED